MNVDWHFTRIDWDEANIIPGIQKSFELFHSNIPQIFSKSHDSKDILEQKTMACTYVWLNPSLTETGISWIDM